jgi:hypothetical protein
MMPFSAVEVFTTIKLYSRNNYTLRLYLSSLSKKCFKLEVTPWGKNTNNIVACVVVRVEMQTWASSVSSK